MSNIESDGLRQGPTKATDVQLNANDMGSILMRLYPDFVLPQKQGYLRDNNGVLVRTKSGHMVQL